MHEIDSDIAAGPQAVPQADRPYLPPRPQAVASCPRPCPRHAHFDDAALLANNKGRRQRQTTPRRNKSLARAEMGSSAKTKTTARTSKRKARPVWGLGRKESASGGLIHGTASSSACKASKAATARRVLVAQAYRYIQRRQLLSDRQD